jgi:ankyrin repeat protein
MKRVTLISLIVFGLSVLSSADNELGTNTEAEQHLKKANELLKSMDYEAAIAEYSKVVSMSSNSNIAQDAQYWIGQSYFRSGQFDAALSAFQKLLDEYPASKAIPATKLMLERVQQAKKNKSLFQAARKGDIEQVKSLISKGADVNAKNRWGYTPLYSALFNKHKDTMRFLVNNGGDVNHVPKGDYPLLHYAIWRKDMEFAKLLVNNGADFKLKDQDGWSAFRYAVDCANRELVDFLIANGVKVSDFHFAAWRGDLDDVKRFVNQGVDVNVKDDQLNWTPLHWATFTAQRNVAEFLIAKGADVNAGGDWNSTPLHYAVAHGHRELVEFLLAKGAEINKETSSGKTPLYDAVRVDNRDIVELLIASGADIEAKNEDGQAPLHLAANRGYKEILELLLEGGADIDAREDQWGNTALHNAAVRGQKEIVELLIDKGADVEARNGNGSTPLPLTAAYSNHEDYIEVVKLLLDKGANIETRGHADSTPLQAAAYVGRKEVAELLLARGAKIDTAASKFFGTATHQAMRGDQEDMVRWCISKGLDIPPLHQAAYFGERDKVQSLLSNGADVNHKDVVNYTPLHCAVLGRKKEIVQLLLEKGADLEAGDCASATPLFLACSQAYLDMVKVLVDNSAEVNSGAFKGLDWGPMHIDKDWTNLHTAAFQGHVDVVKYLLSKGANIYTRCTGLTALHFAAQGNKKGHIEIIECLLDKGIDVNLKDDEERTALDHAKEKNSTKIVELLRKRGAKE